MKASRALVFWDFTTPCNVPAAVLSTGYLKTNVLSSLGHKNT